MIVIQLSGGLGNQMFQYAYGLAIEQFSKDEVFLDMSLLKNYPNGLYNTKRDYELELFDIQLPVIGLVINFRHNVLSKFIYKIVNKYFRIKNTLKLVVQSPNETYVDWLNYGRNVYVIGSFQSYKYMLDIRNLILKSFVHSKELSVLSEKIRSKIAIQESVSIHIRRGDYLKSHNLINHGICGLKYYEDSIKYFEDRFIECHYYIFSDDIEWCRNNIGKDLNYCEYINHNLGNDAWQDIILMKNCKHNIIANSSFSWWGAWLNENIDKIVISPHNWFANAKYEILTSELIPEDWVRL